MSWSYSKDPSSSELDKYRFSLGDTDADMPLLQDEEIQYVIDNIPGHSSRMRSLCESILLSLAKYPKRSLGPMQEDPSERILFYERLLKRFSTSVGVPSMATPAAASFVKGMHDNV